METMDKKNERKMDGQGVMMAMMVETAMKFHSRCLNLMQEYKAKGIDSIPIKTLEQFTVECSMEALKPDSLMSHIIKGE